MQIHTSQKNCHAQIQNFEIPLILSQYYAWNFLLIPLDGLTELSTEEEKKRNGSLVASSGFIQENGE